MTSPHLLQKFAAETSGRNRVHNQNFLASPCFTTFFYSLTQHVAVPQMFTCLLLVVVLLSLSFQSSLRSPQLFCCCLADSKMDVFLCPHFVGLFQPMGKCQQYTFSTCLVVLKVILCLSHMYLFKLIYVIEYLFFSFSFCIVDLYS